MRFILSLLAFLCAISVGSAGQSEAVALALADARRLPPEIAYRTRYLTSWHMVPEWRAETIQAIDYWLNSTSIEALPKRARFIARDLVAVRFDHYAHKQAVWEKLVDNPYWSLKAVKAYPAGQYTNGQRYAAGSSIVFLGSRGVDAEQMAELSRLTNSAAPILNMDWFAAQIAIQEGRVAGYYDFLGAGKKRDEFDKLVGMNRAESIRQKKEIAAIVPKRGPTQNNAQIFRFGTLHGAYWQTRDTDQNTGAKNATRFLDNDFIHVAEEIYAALPNGMLAFYLSDAAGIRANFAPDFIGKDSLSISNDGRIHVGLSCARCHVEGIRPITCWFRKTYDGPDYLNVFGPDRARRIEQLYQSDIDFWIKRDQQDYAHALKQVNGLTPGDNAKVIAAVWERYVELPVYLADAARELGCKPEELKAAIRARKGVDSVLFPWGKAPRIIKGVEEEPEPIRREHWEEVYQYALETLQLNREKEE